jgi:hypothetical protein
METFSKCEKIYYYVTSNIVKSLFKYRYFGWEVRAPVSDLGSSMFHSLPTDFCSEVSLLISSVHPGKYLALPSS